MLQDGTEPKKTYKNNATKNYKWERVRLGVGKHGAQKWVVRAYRMDAS